MNTMIHTKKPKIHSNKPSHQISVLSFLVIIEKISPTKENTGPSTILKYAYAIEYDAIDNKPQISGIEFIFFIDKVYHKKRMIRNISYHSLTSLIRT